ncbi:fibronectin type III domain-containing protein [Geomonas sp. Red32]|uniref:fibronectin type III domain-containing protein n=1 Tax=Geomonas sp. Red32 TaxID=2912856 RepID=UPI00202CC0F1|nr:fibronectin type III domain-containing protein [Geomonas sp. Red32]MCM0081014.1 fibronectin type III domain-containing protein [Geomonas sp. Red32]
MPKKNQQRPKRPLTTWLAGEQIPGLLAQTSAILGRVAAHDCYRPGQNPSAVDAILTSMAKGHATLNQAYLAVLGGDTSQTALRDETKAKLVMDVYHFGNWVEILGRDNPDAMLNTGYAPATWVARNMVPPLLRVTATGLRPSHGSHLRSMRIKFAGAKGVRSWELWWTASDPSVEGNWGFLKSGSTTKFEFDGLEPGRLYYFRIRGVNSRGPGPWSAVVSLRAI